MSEESSEKTFSAKQVATRIGTDAKQLRKFLRDPNSNYEAVGQGGRYDFLESELPKIAAAFAAWSSTKTRRNRTGSTTRAAASTTSVPRPRQSKQSLYQRTLGTDGPADSPSIPARMAKHGLMRDANGRIVEQPEEIRGQLTPAQVMNPYSHIDRSKIPGLVKETPHNELQPIIDHLESGGDDDYDDSDLEVFELIED